ncbi:RNA-binding protein Hfq [Sporomusa ovata DSM 2662]|uniref:RNA-binding protein Hfq n=1 Tax=Sporomusa ovata TaxID=2378 RepID=A0A0U1L217_9FIRM|nr:RNA chaperone Hfq [Sporomusa ovata]EQB25145.1 RNA-binding protein Hfq [Sporomusa ovata DSM 2662]CQR73702.1 RNA-binding protein Hfq [Sporomusa ovata]
MNTNPNASITSASTQKAQLNLQDNFLNQARKENIPVIIHSLNGFPVKGIVRGFDSFTVTLETEGKQQLVYKHTISTILPLRQFSYK